MSGSIGLVRSDPSKSCSVRLTGLSARVRMTGATSSSRKRSAQDTGSWPMS